MKSQAYLKAHRQIALKPLRRVLADFLPQDICKYLSRFSKIELEGWSEEQVNGLQFLFQDMERHLYDKRESE